MFIYSYSYVCSFLYFLFQCVVLCADVDCTTASVSQPRCNWQIYQTYKNKGTKVQVFRVISTVTIYNLFHLSQMYWKIQ